MTKPPVRYEIEDGLARIVLNQPERRNVLSMSLARELHDALDVAASDPLAKVVVLSAEPPAFCAGMDLKSIALDDAAQAAEFAKILAECYRRLLTFPAPLLCGVDGPAMGGAVGLALAADLVWAGPGARLAFPETRVGVVPALVSVPARRRMAPGKLTGMAVSGLECDPARALALGLVDFAVESNAAAEAEAFGRKLIRENSAEAMRRTKAFLQSGFGTELERELAAALREFSLAVATRACASGLAAFRAKSAPDWVAIEKSEG